MIKALATSLIVLASTSTSAEQLTRVDIGSKALLVIAGDFTEGTAARTDTFLNMNPDIREVAFNSRGGMAKEGVALADVLWEHDIKATVNKGYICLSACAFAFIGASDMRIDGILGFHNGYIPAQEAMSIKKADLVNMSIHLGTLTVMHFMENGFGFELPLVIAAYSNKNTFIVFRDEVALLKFTTGPLVEEQLTYNVDDYWLKDHVVTSQQLVLEGYM
jgi:hypothetical protein